MDTDNLYSTAHLFVAAIRICEHTNNAPPLVDDVCKLTSFSRERGNLICNQLREMGIIEGIESPYGLRLFIRNHQKIEDIRHDEKISKFENELKKFKDTRKNPNLSMEAFRTKQAEKKKKLFAEAEEKLKKELNEN